MSRMVGLEVAEGSDLMSALNREWGCGSMGVWEWPERSDPHTPILPHPHSPIPLMRVLDLARRKRKRIDPHPRPSGRHLQRPLPELPVLDEVVHPGLVHQQVALPLRVVADVP